LNNITKKPILNPRPNTHWQPFDEGTSVGKKGSENGTIVYDLEHTGGARVTLEEKTDIAPYATTLGVYGVMFHTRFDSSKTKAEEFISHILPKIENLINLLTIPEEKQDGDWKEKFNALTQELAEQ
jgi:hypothetical protein